MKKFVLLTLIAISFATINIYAQSIPNGGFEIWNSTAYNDPTGWFNGNAKTLMRQGVAPVTRITGQSGYALRIQTYIANGDTSDSYIDNSPDDPTKGIGGVPFTQQPTAITGYYRYNLPGNDTAGLLVFFKKNGVVVSSDIYKIRGTGSQSTWAAFSFPLSLTMVPDTVIIAAVSSNLLSGVGIENGSFLELDQLIFTGVSEDIPNGDFESWNSMTYETPGGWEVQGDSVLKTTDHYSGAYAIRLKTALSGDGMANSSGITTGHSQRNGPTVGGQPYTRTVDTLIGYYKYIPSGADTANIFVNLSLNTVVVGGMGMPLTAASTYTYFQMPFQGSTPDTIRIDASSSHWPISMSAVGSTLYLDNLALKSQLTRIVDPTSNSLQISVFPNPANEVLNITFGKNLSNSRLLIYDFSGQLIMEKSMNGAKSKTSRTDISKLSPGIYQYQIISDEGDFWNKFVKE